MCLLGVADDIWDLDWMAKLAGQVLAALVMAWGGVQLVTVPIAGVTIGSPYVSLVATVVVVVIAINAVNFVDGLDGLAAGMVAIGGLAFFTYTYVLARSASPGDYSSLATLILAVLVGACIGFLPHNMHPARIFMGDSGSMVLGLTIAAAAIIVTGQIDPGVVSDRERVPAFIPIVLPLMVVAVPLIDMTLAVMRRMLRGDSPFTPDAHHLHHLLAACAATPTAGPSACSTCGRSCCRSGRSPWCSCPAGSRRLLIVLGITVACLVTFSERTRARPSPRCGGTSYGWCAERRTPRNRRRRREPAGEGIQARL